MKRASLRIFLVLGVCVLIALPTIWGFFGRPRGPVTLKQTPALPPAENAYDLLVSVGRKIQLPSQGVVNLTDEERTQFLEKHQEHLKEISAALKKNSRISVITSSTNQELVLSNLGLVKRVGILIQMRGQEALTQNRWGDTAESAMEGLEFAEKVATGADLIHASIKLGQTTRFVEQLQSSLRELKAEQLDRLVPRLAQLEKNRARFSDILHQEELTSRKLKKELNIGMVQGAIMKNSLGKTEEVFLGKYEEAYRGLQRLVVEAALLRYQLKNQKLPDSLADLVPVYLPELPKRESMGALVYRPEGEKYDLQFKP